MQASGGIVYHASEWGDEIVASGAIRGQPVTVREDLVHNRQHHGMVGISCTRDSRFARLYAPCVFALDWRSIRFRHPSIPRAEGAYGEQDYRIEAEELVVARELALDAYCIGIWLDRHMAADPESGAIIAHPRFHGFFHGHHG